MVKKIRPYAVLIAVAIIVISKLGARLKEDYFPTTKSQTSSSSEIRHIGDFELLENCQWVDMRNNDGDSFMVKHEGNEYVFRLYFVDAPEKYISDKYQNQRKRVVQQGEYFGGLSPEQSVEIGIQAKGFTERKLKGKSFTVLTKWESVFDSERFYAFVWLPGSTEDKPNYLCEALVKNGFARIYTKGPGDQKDYSSGRFDGDQKVKGKQLGGKVFEERLHQLEAQAKKSKIGAWGAE